MRGIAAALAEDDEIDGCNSLYDDGEDNSNLTDDCEKYEID